MCPCFHLYFHLLLHQRNLLPIIVVFPLLLLILLRFLLPLFYLLFLPHISSLSGSVSLFSPPPTPPSSLKGIYPYWFQPFSTVQNVTISVTRQRNNLVDPRTKTDTGAKAFSVNGPKMWNSLPVSVCSATTLSSFKSRLTKDMLGGTRDTMYILIIMFFCVR